MGTKTLNPGYEHLLSPAHFVNEYKLSTKLLQEINNSAVVADTTRGSGFLIFVHDPDTTDQGKDYLFNMLNVECVLQKHILKYA